ncbi:MAG: glycoside hydrolase family 5 protein [Bacilli bacterium]|jgi:aryl-phospho-beta-D-glucosidase BglC (GH1 family)|nr:glycoside hydrolase family 5 protein [Bacilli bacterium]
MDDKTKTEEPVNQPISQPKKKHKVLKIVLIVIVVILMIPALFLATVSIYHHTYSVNKGPETITNDTGLIQAEGRSLYDKDGNRIQLKGVNAGNTLVNEGWLGFWCDGYKTDSNGTVSYPDFNQEQLLAGLKANPNLSESQGKELLEDYHYSWFSKSDFAIVHDTLKMNTIRLPFYWRDILNDDYSVKSEGEAFMYLDWFIGNAKANNLYVVLDLHGCPHSQNGYEHSGLQSEGAAFWNNTDAVNAVIRLWTTIATRYTATLPELGKAIASYDLINEPTSTYGGSTDKTVWAVYDKIYEAIRATGDRHVITMEGAWDFTALPNPDDYSWANIQYEYHWYNWYTDKLPYLLYYDYMDMKNMGRDYNVPVYIGEFTYFEDKAAWKAGMNLFDNRNYSWTIWNYKAIATGDWTTSWGVYTLKLGLSDKESDHKTKVDVSSATYDELKAAIANCITANCVTGTTYEMINYENSK